MFKKILATFAGLLLTLSAFAAVDVNKASQAELEALKGIGPVISTLIVNERKKGNFKDWNDLVVRVKGVGDRSAEKFSEAGLTVNGATYTGVPVAAAKVEKADKVEKKAEKAAEKAPMTVRAASATPATSARAASAVKTSTDKASAKDSGQEAKDKRAAAKTEKAEKKAARKAERDAAASAPAKK